MKTILTTFAVFTALTLTSFAQRESFKRELPKPPTESQILIALVEKGEITLNNEVLFKFDSTEFAAKGAEEQLALLAKIMDDKRLAKSSFIIEGHTCDRGETDYNQTLSEKRAAHVVKFLKKQGVNGKRLESVGYGETRPLAENTIDPKKDKPDELEYKRRMNRRVVIRRVRE